MSSSLMSSLNLAGQLITIYAGIPIFIAGILGGALNIIVFLSLKTFRQSSCAFYLTVMSFMSVGQLTTGLLTRIMITGFNIDWTQTSMFYCKIRLFILYTASLISASCLCLATIDQYLATCIHPRWQQWCNIKIARGLITIFSILCLVEQIPSLVFYNQIISPTTNQTICTITNNNYVEYNSYLTIIVLWYVLPVLITVMFGMLAYRNVQQIAYRTVPLVRRELDKQLTVMVLVQVIFNFIAVMPNFIIYILNINEALKTNLYLEIQLSFAATIVNCVFYLYFSCPFYIYICVSKRFRRQLNYVILNISLNRVQQRMAIINQIAPMT